MMENLALRHQLMVLKRNRPKPRFTEPDRLFWVIYSKLVKGWQGFLEIASPRTVVDWNKRRFKRYWANKSDGLVKWRFNRHNTEDMDIRKFRDVLLFLFWLRKLKSSTSTVLV